MATMLPLVIVHDSTRPSTVAHSTVSTVSYIAILAKSVVRPNE